MLHACASVFILRGVYVNLTFTSENRCVPNWFWGQADLMESNLIPILSQLALLAGSALSSKKKTIFTSDWQAQIINSLSWSSGPNRCFDQTVVRLILTLNGMRLQVTVFTQGDGALRAAGADILLVVTKLHIFHFSCMWSSRGAWDKSVAEAQSICSSDCFRDSQPLLTFVPKHSILMMAKRMKCSLEN